MLSTTLSQTVPPTTPEELKRKLQHGPVRFAFKKTDGALRIAYGTLDLSKIPADHHPKSGKPAPDTIIPFYDLEKFCWRSVSTSQLIFC